MGVLGEIVILDTDIFSECDRNFIYDIVSAGIGEDINKAISPDEKKYIQPHQERDGYNKRNPGEFKNILLKIMNFLKENNNYLYEKHKKDFNSFINICDTAIKENKQIDFTWSN